MRSGFPPGRTPGGPGLMAQQDYLPNVNPYGLQGLQASAGPNGIPGLNGVQGPQGPQIQQQQQLVMPRLSGSARGINNSGFAGYAGYSTATGVGLGNGFQVQSRDGLTASAVGPGIRNVWRWNLEEQFSVLRDVIDQYKYISMDCKFPGIVARPIGTFKSTSEYHYQTLRSNVDILEVIQIGLTFSDEQGNPPSNNLPSTWQFNFHFDLSNNMCSADGIELLRQSGIDFSKHLSEGIDVFKFGELLVSSGLVLDDSVNWITFHSGYDFGYLMSILLNNRLAVEESEFLKELSTYFPCIWDVKYIIKAFKLSSKTNLTELAEELGVIGQDAANGLNQAGSDSSLTNGCFFELKRMTGPDLVKTKGLLFGLGEAKEDDGVGSTGSEADSKGLSHSVSSSNAASVFQFGKMGGI